MQSKSKGWNPYEPYDGHDCKTPGMSSDIGFFPFNDRLVVKKDPEEKITTGGIIIPDNVHEKRFTGTVVALGSGYPTKRGCCRNRMDVKEYDRVIFMHYVGHNIKIDGQEYVLLKEKDLLGVVED